MGEYRRQIAEQETAIREARCQRGDAQWSGNQAGVQAAEKKIDEALDTINVLRVMEQYRAQD